MIRIESDKSYKQQVFNIHEHRQNVVDSHRSSKVIENNHNHPGPGNEKVPPALLELSIEESVVGEEEEEDDSIEYMQAKT